MIYEDYLYIIDADGKVIKVKKSSLSEISVIKQVGFSIRAASAIYDGNLYFAIEGGKVVKIRSLTLI